MQQKFKGTAAMVRRLRILIISTHRIWRMAVKKADNTKWGQAIVFIPGQKCHDDYTGRAAIELGGTCDAIWNLLDWNTWYICRIYLYKALDGKLAQAFVFVYQSQSQSNSKQSFDMLLDNETDCRKAQDVKWVQFFHFLARQNIILVVQADFTWQQVEETELQRQIGHQPSQNHRIWRLVVKNHRMQRGHKLLLGLGSGQTN